jgi:uncharacterized protein (TIGR00255 family)
MTGYGRADFQLAGSSFDVEAKSVNHRYLDARAKLPRPLSDHDGAVKAIAQKKMQRGKLDIHVSASGQAPAPKLEIDHAAAGQYVEAGRALVDEFEVGGTLDVTTLLSLPGVVRVVEHETEASEASEKLLEAVDVALEALDAMRVREGEALAADLRMRLDRIAGLSGELEGRAELVVEAVRAKLRRRSEQLQEETGLLDEARLLQEVVIAADRLDITEELVRLRSHVEQFQGILREADRDTAVGRRLDFLLQEMGREANTVGSKANDAELAHFVVSLKTELERLREQVQNVE